MIVTDAPQEQGEYSPVRKCAISRTGKLCLCENTWKVGGNIQIDPAGIDWKEFEK